MAESKNIQSGLIPKIATGFCGGMARTSGICGAVSGAVMAISMFCGRSLPDEPIDRCYAPIKELIHMFESRFGATNCRDLTGCDLGTDEGRKRYFATKMLEKCRNYTEEATRIAISIIEEET